MPGSPALTATQMQAIARALADPRRYEILRRVGKKPFTPCANLRAALDISPATLSHHMKELELAGLVTSARDGRTVVYTPQPELLRVYLKQLADDLA